MQTKNSDSLKNMENKIDSILKNQESLKNSALRIIDSNIVPVIGSPPLKIPQVRLFVRNTARKVVTGIYKFNDIQMNVGGGYDPFTGYFTAPVKGVYYFSLNILKRSTDSWFNLNHRKNGETGHKTVTSAICSASNARYANMAASTIIALDEGDQLYVDFHGSSANWNWKKNGKPHAWNTMSGFLIPF